MTNPLQALFEAGVIAATDFPPESRYHGVAVLTHVGPDGVPRPHLARRLVPDPGAVAARAVHRVAGGERLDQIAAAALGDPAAWWRIADANPVLWPGELEALDARVRLPLPPGVPGPDDEEG